jgi:AbrB family looped-hinge helix DNA binding protein
MLVRRLGQVNQTQQPGADQKTEALARHARASGPSFGNDTKQWHIGWYNAIMNTTLTIDKAGRVVLPKPVRDALEISPGDSLELESSEDRIVLRPARSAGRMYKKHGAWVFDSGEPLSADVANQTIRRVRDERHRRNLGKVK